MSKRPLATDWATDFDHLDPRWTENPYPIWDELRQKCPIAHTERFMGAYLPSRYEDVRAIAYDTEHFSSRRPVVRESRPPLLPAPPITSDPPEHRPAKQILLPAFTPEMIGRHEPRTRDICRELIGRIAGKSRCDGAVDYAQEIPVRVIAHMLGVPGRRRRAVPHLDQGNPRNRRHRLRRADARAKRDGRLFRRPDRRAAQKPARRPDRLSAQRARSTTAAFTDKHINGMLRLLMIAGIDTTWSAIGSCLWHLAQHADDRRRLAADADLHGLGGRGVPARLRAGDHGARGRQGDADQRLHLQARADDPVVVPRRQPRSGDVSRRRPRSIIDRAHNRHAAFGLGIHRCIGSNLARMEISVALTEWLKSFPEFRLDPQAAVTWSVGTVRGPRQLPLLLDA